MPIPTLNHLGLLPGGVHVCTLSDIKENLCWNAHRANVWDGCLRFLDWIRPQGMGTVPIYIDGSFVTDKEIPGDVDVVLDLVDAHDLMRMQGLLWFFEKRPLFKEEFCVDYCINLPGENDFSHFFQYVGVKTASIKGLQPNDMKGILRVEQWTHG